MYDAVLTGLRAKMKRQTEALAETAAHISAIERLQTQDQNLKNKNEPELPLNQKEKKKD